MTKKEMFAEIRKVVIDNEEMVAFIDREIELLNRKSNAIRKPTKTQVENEQFKADIVSALTVADRPCSIKELFEICDSIKGLTNQRVTHMLTDLVKGAVIERTVVKKVPYFAIAVG